MKTNKYYRSVAASAALLLLTAATPGCFVAAVGAAGAAGAGTVAYVRGELDATLGNPYESVVRASDNALAQLQFAIVSNMKDAFTAEVIARTAEDKKIDIKVHREADDLTKVTIRIGIFGDEEKSRAILEKIRANLGGP